jgi:CRISPR-associated protein Csb1
MSESLSRFDVWIAESGPSAWILKEYLEPAAGPGDVIFPPTFAPPEDAKDAHASYIIDDKSGKRVCLLDSVGSQANRMEPLFKLGKYRALVPQVEIKVKERKINLLDVGHRAADAVVRSTELAADLEKTFVECAAGNAEPLANIAPTSLVFGAWDSRGSQAKVPRLIDSTVRAFGVTELSRSAQYFSALETDEVEELLGKDAQGRTKALSKAGFLDAPSGRTHGGVIVDGTIVRTTILNLTALRALGANDSSRQLALRRYVLGLAMIVALAPVDLFLRQGCLLVRAGNKPLESSLVFRDGRRQPLTVAMEDVEAFAKTAAEAFGVGEERTVDFDPKRAKELLKKATKEKTES